MDHVMKLVTMALQWSYAQAEVDVSPKHLEAAAEQLTLRCDKIHVVDAQNLKKEENGKSESPEEPEEPAVRREEKRGRKKHSPENSESLNPK